MRKAKNIAGRKIARLRLKAGLTQLELAGRLRGIGVRIDRAGVAKIERGMRHVLDYELVGFATALKSKIWKLF